MASNYEKKALVTGATGFLGRRMVSQLLAQGWHVYAMTHRQPLPENLWIGQGHVTSVSTSDPAKVRQAVSECTALFHLAAYIPLSFDDWKEAAPCYQANALLTLELAEMALECGAPRLVYFSSGQAYRYSESPVTEECALFPSNRASYYLGSKLLGEIYLEHARIRQNLPALTLRLGSVYGAGMSEKSVVHRFMLRASRGLPLEVWDGGVPTCDYVYADDVIGLAINAAARVKPVSLTPPQARRCPSWNLRRRC